MSAVKRYKDDDQSFSPSKVPKIDDEHVTHEDKLSESVGLLGPGKEPPIIKPKPKPKIKPKPVPASQCDQIDAESPGEMDPGIIKLSEDSLVQFGQVVDLDAVVRYQLLDNTPQKDRAALSQSKGLKDRRLPQHVASIVGDERPPKRKFEKETEIYKPQNKTVEEPDVGELTEEERQQKLMSKVGISQGNPLAALGNILRKGQGRGSGRDSKSPRREFPVTKKSSFKGSKESVGDRPKDSPELTRRISEPKSPKMFRFGIRRSSSRSKKGDDSMSDTSSVNSLNIAVKEEPMEVECSGLTVSRSVGEKEQMVVKREFGDQSSSVSAGDASKSANRNSTYFKPPEVEPLSDLFATGELDALLRAKEGMGSGTPMASDAEVEEETLEKSEREEQVGTESGLKRSNLRSSFRMYENRYREETMERKKDKSPLSQNVAKISKETTASSSSDLPSQTLDVAESHSANCVEGRDTSTEDTSTNCDAQLSTGDDKLKTGDVRQHKLLEDDLFQSDLSTKSEIVVNSSHGSGPNIDADDKAHRPSSPVDIIGKDQAQAVKSDNNVIEERKGVSSTAKLDGQFCETNVGLSDMTSKNVDISGVPPKDLSGGNEVDSVVLGNNEGITEGVPTVKKAETTDQLPGFDGHMEEKILHQDVSVEHPDSKKEINPGLDSVENVIAKDDKETSTPVSTSEPISGQLFLDPNESEVDVSSRKLPSTRKSNQASQLQHRKEEKEQKSSRGRKSNDLRYKIESGKVSSAKSRFVSSSQVASSKNHRDRASTECSRTATDKTKMSDGQPSWMTDLQKRREQRAKEKEKTSSIKPATGDSGENMPDWRKRVLERRKKAEETKAAGIGKKTDHIAASPKFGRRHEVKVRSTKTAKDGEKNTSNGKPFTKKGEKTTKSTEMPTSINTDDDTAVLEPKKINIEDTKCEYSSVHEEHNLEQVSTNPNAEVKSIPDVTSDVTSPKPEVTSPKPKIQVATRKVEYPSSSESPDGNPSSETKIVKDKNDVEDDVFVHSDVREVNEDSKISPANLQNQELINSQPISQRNSHSSEQEVGVPFRSRGISTSRSPTPTSLTPGPLKLSNESEIPEWKRKVLERKKDSSLAKKPLSTKATEQELPAWKKELLEKRTKLGEDLKSSSRTRTSTVPTRPLSSARSDRKKERPVPEFMKEFQSKKKSTS